MIKVCTGARGVSKRLKGSEEICAWNLYGLPLLKATCSSMGLGGTWGLSFPFFTRCGTREISTPIIPPETSQARKSEHYQGAEETFLKVSCLQRQRRPPSPAKVAMPRAFGPVPGGGAGGVGGGGSGHWVTGVSVHLQLQARLRQATVGSLKPLASHILRPSQIREPCNSACSRSPPRQLPLGLGNC